MTVKMKAVISLRKFADLIGCVEGTVRAAIKEGKISEAVKKDKNGKNRGINWKKGQEEWARNYTVGNNLTSTVEEGLSGIESKRGTVIGEISASRKKTEHYKSELARIELEEKTGILVPVDDVKKQLFAFATEIRIKFQNIPDVCLDEIMSMDNRNEAYALLSKTIDNALNEMTEVVERDFT